MNRVRRGLVLGLTMLLTATGCTSAARTTGGRSSATTPSAQTSAPPSAVGGAAAAAENAKRGTAAWRIDSKRIAGPLELAGYADHVSVRSGQSFRLFVTSTAGAFTVRSFRIGWYGGTGGRLVWTSPSVPGRAQPAPAVRPSDHLVSTKWQPSLTVPTTGWPAGAYLLLMTATNGKQKYVPITIRSDSTRDAVVIVDAVNTYQAYNDWGGYSLSTTVRTSRSARAPTGSRSTGRTTATARGPSCSPSCR